MFVSKRLRLLKPQGLGGSGMSAARGSKRNRTIKAILNALSMSSDPSAGLVVQLKAVKRRSGHARQEDKPRELNEYAMYVVRPSQEGVQLWINGNKKTLGGLSAIVCEPGDETRFETAGSEESPLWEFRFEMNWESSSAAAEEDSPDIADRLIVPLTDYRMERLCRTAEACWNGDALERLRCQSLFLEMLYGLFRQARETSRQNTHSAVFATKEYMDRHFREKLTIEQLANMTGTSQGYFMQMFKTTYGCSPIEYIAQCRIDEARRLLRRMPEMPLREVAGSVGYDDEGYFSRRFRQKLGVSPNAYRKCGGFKAVAMDYHTIGHLLALQMIPSAARLDPKYVREYYERYHGDVELHLDRLKDDESVRRMLIEHRPDLIVVRDNTAPDTVAELRRLASVLVLPWNPSVQWRELFRLTAACLHQETQAERWLLQYDRQAESVRRRIPITVRRDTLAILAVNETGIFIVGNRHVGAVLYQDLGLTPADLPSEPMRKVDPEQLETMEADRLMLLVDNGPAARRMMDDLVRRPAWNGLRAVRNRKVHLVDRGLWFEYTPHAHYWSLSAAARLFG
ncbi:helix-turn-helix domain-containing protein [Cohnella cellulosilytica]|uniref:Helix-turn-helix domain-containing protein n=1 Tax=Cohnella cellulosilytica TaxID=986710 RepID=A0ABW2FM69_9BACL